MGEEVQDWDAVLLHLELPDEEATHPRFDV